MLLEMAADGLGERTALGSRDGGMTFANLAVGARRLGAYFAARNGERVALVDLNSEAVPLTLFGAAIAGKPYVPINYRLADDQLRAIECSHPDAAGFLSSNHQGHRRDITIGESPHFFFDGLDLL